MQTGDSSKKAKLVNAFAVKAGQICSGEKHEVMQKWLEDSFDLIVEIRCTLFWTQAWSLQEGSCWRS